MNRDFFRALFEYMADALGGFLKQYLGKKKIEAQAQESLEPLKKAKTGQEISDATDDALDGM